MRRRGWTQSVRSRLDIQALFFGSWRDRLAVLAALVTVACLMGAFILAKDTRFLMPGPLASAHASIDKCSTCHTQSGAGKLSWMRGLFASDPVADSNACLACHKMPDTAFHAHGAAPEVLRQSTERLAQTAAQTRTPRSARVQSIAFPTDTMVAHGLHCATCHQEHQGTSFKLSKMSNEQCRSCHVVKFERFDKHHPEFANYPFQERTRIIYDHAGHFSKHFPEVAKKDPARSVPTTCSACHNSRDDRRVMAVAPFEQTCTACHLDQIVGKERVSGPKGIAFLTVPGLDLQTLRKKRVSVGEWPEASEAELTPFMKVMISRGERGRALIKTVEGLNLQDLSAASDPQIRAVAGLAWEVKRLFYALMTGKASDVLADLGVGGTAPSAGLVADLTASIPRDVVVGAHQQWLPNLVAEMASRPEAASAAKAGRPDQASQPAPVRSVPETAKAAAPEPHAAVPEPSAPPARPEPANRTLADERPHNRPAGQTDDLLNPTPEELRAGARPGKPAVKGYTAYAGPDGVRETSTGTERPRAPDARARDGEKVAQAEGAARRPAGAGKGTPAADEQPQGRAADQTDDLLNPTEEELRGAASPARGAGKAAQPEGAPRKGDAARARPDSPAPADARAKANANAAPAAPPDAAPTRPQPRVAPVAGIRSDVDAESWAEYGGWYRQDFAIFYRPTGHKDRFIHAWLLLTGPEAPKGSKAPATAVFDHLTAKDAQGSCTKCHSVDDLGGKGRLVNFSPAKAGAKHGRFTNFIHEPHFGVLENRGCLTCHELEKGRPYLQSYEQGNPKVFSSNFGAVKKDLCESCHTTGSARQDCLTCHKYHVNGVATPIMKTRNPEQ